nr:unnamed protein product [Callosobruchus chinensis]
MKIIEAIIEGERDSETLAEFRDVRMKNDQSATAKALAGDYREEHLFTLKQEFELYNIYQEKIAECDRNIEAYYKTFETKSCESKQLSKQKNKNSKSKPSFALYEELHRITEVGINHSKWPTEKHFSSWLGLSPANKVTGEKVFNTRTRKVINRAANALRIAAHSVGNSKSALGAYYRTLKKRLGAPKAITATARKMACIFHSMLKYGQEYVEKGMEYYETRYKDRTVKNLIKKASEFGYILVQQEELVDSIYCEHKSTILHLLAENSDCEAIQGILTHIKEKHSDRFSCVLNAKNKYNITPLHSAVYGGNLNVIEYLVEKNADINAKDKDGLIPLHVAAEYGNLEAVKYFIEKGIDVNVKDGCGSTPLHMAALYGNLEIVEYLVVRGADINAEAKGIFYSGTSLHMAAKGGNLEVVEYLVKRGAYLSAEDKDGMTLLHVAAENE